jgi:hypothetical protein
MTDPIINIRDALEAALSSISPAIHIVNENAEVYEPLPGVPYCEAYLLPATPSNPTAGTGFYQEQGVFQVTLQYPPLTGSLPCATQAGLIRALLKRGAVFTDGGIKVQIDKTPEVGQGAVQEGRWRQVVKIRWHSDIFN